MPTCASAQQTAGCSATHGYPRGRVLRHAARHRVCNWCCATITSPSVPARRCAGGHKGHECKAVAEAVVDSKRKLLHKLAVSNPSAADPNGVTALFRSVGDSCVGRGCCRPRARLLRSAHGAATLGTVAGLSRRTGGVLTGTARVGPLSAELRCCIPPCCRRSLCAARRTRICC